MHGDPWKHSSTTFFLLSPSFFEQKIAVHSSSTIHTPDEEASLQLEKNGAQFESATSEAMAKIWIGVVGRQDAKEFGLKEAKLDFLRKHKNDI